MPTTLPIQHNFELRWRRARALENAGQAASAKVIYESLISEDPNRLYVRLRLSSLEQAEGNYRVARMHAVRCAEGVRTARWNDLASVTRRLLAFDERELVRELIMGADWNHLEILKSSAILSQHLWLIGEVPDALRLIDVAISQARPSSILGYAKANALRYLGRMAEATDQFEGCLRINPSDPYVHWSLAYHEKSAQPAARVDRIRKAQAAFPAESQEQVYLHYALFKEFDDAGDTEQAWSHLSQGAALKRKRIRYDPEAERQGFDMLRAEDQTPLPQHDSGADRAGIVPIFILGMPRSGTTLLERIIGSHSEVTAAGELNDANSVLCWESNQFLPHFVTPDSLERLRGIDHASVGRRYLERTRCWTQGRRYLIDKNPGNFVHAGILARALPQAKILCLRRNPMDACLSSLKMLFTNEAFGYSYDLNEMADYYLRFDRLCTHWRDTLGDRFMEVDYEALVREPAEMATKVMEFCGLSYEPGSIDITRNTSPVTTASSSQVRQPINTRGIDAWRKYELGLRPLQMRLEQELGVTA